MTDYVYACARMRNLYECSAGNCFVGKLLCPLVGKLTTLAQHIVEVNKNAAVRNCVAQPSVVGHVALERIHCVRMATHCGKILRSLHCSRSASVCCRVVWNLASILLSPNEPTLFCHEVVRQVHCFRLSLQFNYFHSGHKVKGSLSCPSDPPNN